VVHPCNFQLQFLDWAAVLILIAQVHRSAVSRCPISRSFCSLIIAPGRRCSAGRVPLVLQWFGQLQGAAPAAGQLPFFLSAAFGPSLGPLGTRKRQLLAPGTADLIDSASTSTAGSLCQLAAGFPCRRGWASASHSRHLAVVLTSAIKVGLKGYQGAGRRQGDEPAYCRYWPGVVPVLYFLYLHVN
jgi:hypothetical protein